MFVVGLRFTQSCSYRLMALISPAEWFWRRLRIAYTYKGAPDETIAQVNRIPQRLHRERALFQPRQVAKVRNGPEPKQQVVVTQIVVVVVDPMRHRHDLAGDIDRLHVAREELDTLQQLSD